MKKRVHKLQDFFPEDFQLICIAAHQSDYRLSWALNEQLQLSLQKDQDLVVTIKKTDIRQHFTRFSFMDTNQHIRYYLIDNKSRQGFLLPEMKNIDFLLKVEGQPERHKLLSMVEEIRKISFVVIAYLMEDIPIKHKKKFIF
jgi:hypothetical protein